MKLTEVTDNKFTGFSKDPYSPVDYGEAERGHLSHERGLRQQNRRRGNYSHPFYDGKPHKDEVSYLNQLDKQLSKRNKQRLEPSLTAEQDTIDGKPYNLIVKYVGPAQAVQTTMESALEHTFRNIHHDVAHTETINIGDDEDDNTRRGLIFVLVRQGSDYTSAVKAIEQADGVELAPPVK